MRSFTVRPRLPEPLAGLGRLAANLRWSWDQPTRELFDRVDPGAWDETVHDPERLLGVVAPERLAELAADDDFLARLREAEAALDAYLTRTAWFQGRHGSPLRRVAYFSPEFGIAEAVPQYSGGLGVLAGDHLKACSDLGVPLVGIGLFYRHGYFRQSLDVDGWQRERFPSLDPYAMAVTLCEGVRVEVPLAERTLVAQVWRADVGRTPLYLLDADVDENPDDLRLVTDRLYGGDTEHRLRQEILLGMGGVRALEALGEEVQVFHTNEGHAGFLGLERIRQLVVERGLGFGEALEATRAGCVFTTHTPVPAGIDRFPRELMERYFAGWAAECGIDVERLMALGHRPGDPPEERFNMAVMGMRLADHRNGVARLHGEVSRAMFADLWPDVPEGETPVGHITNGVHGRTWVSPEIDALLSRAVGPDWPHREPEAWDGIADLDDLEVWLARLAGRTRLVAFARDRLRAAGLARGLSESELAWTADALDPEVLTIGFARRMASYKRATLLLSQPERLKALLLDEQRPMQILFAGKAHPADEAGKELIRRIVAFSRDPEVRHRICFIDDYDIAVARAMLQGADVWLNTPRRPMEASGTSGMKAALNGALNCSILDGWWAECFATDNGWAISSAQEIEDEHRRDELEAGSLFDLLEHQVVPLFYRRDGATAPADWLAKVRSGWRSLGPFVSASRMVRDYVEHLYEPTARRADALAAEHHAGARAFAAWRARVEEGWHTVHVDTVEASDDVADLGTTRAVSAVVSLGRLGPDDVEVQLLHGPVGQHDELLGHEVVPLRLEGPAATDGHLRYTGELVAAGAGRHGYTVRVVPSHPDLVAPQELGRIAWASG